MRRLFLVLVLLWPLGAWADWDAADRAFDRGDWPTAAREYRPYAEADNAAAQFNLGVVYRKMGNDREAVRWFRMAAEQGDADAQFNLGNLYHKGEGVPEDDRDAVRWYHMAAEQGHASAQFNLGVMYDNGVGVSEDDREAARWYRMAAEQGDADAQLNLGVMYGTGKGVPEDFIQAYAWYNLAAAQGNERAAKNRSIIRPHMTPAQVAKAQDLSKSLARRIEQNRSATSVGRGVAPPPRAEGPPRTVVAQVQQLLTLLGYRPGPTDGIAGERTRAAVGAFQSDMKMTPTAVISQELLALLQITVAAVTVGSQDSTAEPTQRSSGSGFYVSDAGHIVTNRHVIADCKKVTVAVGGRNQSARVEQADEANDLALLKLSGEPSGVATFRQSRRAELGEAVTVAGFPLVGLLADDLNVTNGGISALAGPGNDARLLQVTAPVHSGNSGGPLLDKAGNVVGVVVAKLDALKAYKATGDFPQNINFAIKGTLVRGFLDIHGVDYRTSGEEVGVGGEAIAANARTFVVRVGCWQ